MLEHPEFLKSREIDTEEPGVVADGPETEMVSHSRDDFRCSKMKKNYKNYASKSGELLIEIVVFEAT